MSRKPEKTQADKFREAARDLECDLDEEAFDRALGKIAKAPVSDDEPPAPPKKGEKPDA